MRIESEKKLAFYPTDTFEIYRMMPVIGAIDTIKYYTRQEEFSDYIDSREQRRLRILSLDTGVDWKYIFYDYLINNYHYELVKDFFNISYGYAKKPIVIADLFCGEAEWLKLMAKGLELRNNSELCLVGNEIEEERYKKAKKGLDHCYLGAAEELQFPSNSVSLMLFNPPYGDSNGERNARRYLKLIIENQYLRNTIKEEQMQYDPASYIICVLNKRDTLDCLDLLCQNFEIKLHYKVNPEEYDIHKQIVLYARRIKPLDLNTRMDAIKFETEYSKWKYSIDADREFKIEDYKTVSANLAGFDIETILDNYSFKKSDKKYISVPDDRLWKNLKSDTTIIDYGVSEIHMPKPPKPSEIANIIAAGYINTEYTREDIDVISHIAIGGVRIVKTEEVATVLDDKGNEIRETTYTKKSEPYLNILYTDDGKIQTKQLGEVE